MAIEYDDYDFTVGDIGVPIRAKFPFSLEGLSLQWKFTKPSGSTLTKTPTSTEHNIVTYRWQAGDLDESGQWTAKLQNLTTGYTYHTYAIFNVIPA